jgi:flagellar assembly protein FliH
MAWQILGQQAGHPRNLARARPPHEESPQPPEPRAERQAAIDDAYKRGLADGEERSAEKAQREVAGITERVSRSIESLATLRARLRREAEQDLIKLAMAIARRVLNRELSIDPESIHGLVKVALDRLLAKEVSRVRVHPDHEEAVRRALHQREPSRQIPVTADHTLRFGDVIFETSQGSLDASVETQFKEIERGFADRMGS